MKKILLPFAFLIAFSSIASSQVWLPKAAGLLPANYGVDDISIVNEQVIWATANDYSTSTPSVPADHVSKLIKSTDGGETWTVADIEEATGRFCWDIHAFDENTACVTTTNRGSGNKRGIFRTTDGGTTWTEVFNHPAGDLWMHFFDGQEGVCGSGEDIARTVNGGATWTPVPTANIPNLMTGEIIGGASLSNGIGTSSNSVWFGTSKGRVFKTADRGQNWTAHNTGLGANSFLYSFGFIDEKNGLGVFDIGGVAELARTTDGGLTWAKTGNFDFTLVDAIPCANTFMGASYNAGSERTAFSTDHGTSWTVRDTTLAANAHVFVRPDLGWTANAASVGSGPALYKWIGGSLDTRIYVNKNATGANTGASWADAYTDLQAALAAAQTGDEIWVAEGTYKPAAPGGSQAATFLINKDLKLYGGFAGTECNLTERDVALHPTVLSGDLNGDDIDSNFTQNRADNVLHVVQAASAVTNETVIDGFTVRGGHADGGGNLSDGGGIICSGKPVVRQCIFEQNFAFRNGGAVRLNSISTPGVVFEDCQFKQNQANTGGGMSILSSFFTITGCVFSNNAAVSGALQASGGGLRIDQSSGDVNHCDFIGNQSALYGGGLVAIDYLGSPGNSNVEVSDCHFQGNSSGASDGGLSLNSWVNNNSYAARRCTFDSNTAVNLGGGLSVHVQPGSGNTAVVVDSCIFSQNTAGRGSGLGAILEGSGTSWELSNSTFEGNNTIVDYGTAIVWTFSATTAQPGTAIVDNCLFQNNNSIITGGLDIGSGQNSGPFEFTISNSDFLNNHAGGNCGGFDIWGDNGSKPAFTVDNCLIEGNTAGDRAGGFWMLTSSEDFQGTMKNCRILNNQSSSGGAIGIFLADLNSFAFPEGAQFTIENTLIAGNSSSDAAIAVDSFPGLNLLNCTVTGNTGGGIQLSDKSTLRLQNTILYNPNHTEYQALTNDVAFTSNGGNLIGDGSLDGLILPTDKQNLDPLFVGAGDFHLTAGSPCVDAGNNDGVTATLDLDGLPRIQGLRVDMGAYESGFTPVREVIAGEVTVSPNPATSFLNIKLPEAVSGQYDLEVFDPGGRLVRNQILAEGQRFDIQDLEAGVYALKAIAGERVYVGKFAKQ